MAQHLLFFLVGETGLRCQFGVGCGALADTAPANEDLGFKELLALPGFTLDVVHGTVLLDVGIEAKDPGIAIGAWREM